MIAQEQLPPCEMPVEEDEGNGWHEVEGEGFVFCIPGHWRASGDRRWRGGGGWIEWGTGERPRRVIQRRTTVVRADQLDRLHPSSPSDVERSTEMIGGGIAELFLNSFEGSYYTGATWRAPELIYMSGETRLRMSARLHLQIYRTVRFSGD